MEIYVEKKKHQTQEQLPQSSTNINKNEAEECSGI